MRLSAKPPSAQRGPGLRSGENPGRPPRTYDQQKANDVFQVLVRQAQLFPLAAMLVTIVAGLFVPHYSSMTQHVSELGVIAHPAAAVMPVAAIVAGASVVVFGLGLWLHPSRSFRFTSVAAVVFGVSFISAGIFPTGTALHGLYGLTMFYVLVPACFAAELPPHLRTGLAVPVSLAAACLSLIYMWGLLSGLEPHALRGLTQRLAILVIFGWYPFASAVLLRESVRVGAPLAPRHAG